jgi:hypothetical protein
MLSQFEVLGDKHQGHCWSRRSTPTARCPAATSACWTACRLMSTWSACRLIPRDWRMCNGSDGSRISSDADSTIRGRVAAPWLNRRVRDGLSCSATVKAYPAVTLTSPLCTGRAHPGGSGRWRCAPSSHGPVRHSSVVTSARVMFTLAAGLPAARRRVRKQADGSAGSRWTHRRRTGRRARGSSWSDRRSWS